MNSRVCDLLVMSIVTIYSALAVVDVVGTCGVAVSMTYSATLTMIVMLARRWGGRFGVRVRAPAGEEAAGGGPHLDPRAATRGRIPP